MSCFAALSQIKHPLNVSFHQRANHVHQQAVVDVCLPFPTSSISFPGFDLRSAQVVSLATGTKCLDSDNVSDHGGMLTDCHAEVVSRRALVQFLYAQLELLLWY